MPAPVNRPSMAGISQTSLTCSASAPALSSLPAMRTVRLPLSSREPAAKSGADLDLVLARHDLRRDGEAAGPLFAAKLAIGAAAQALTGTEQRHRLEQIGLARAIVADQHHGPRVELELGSRVVAEIGELQRADEEARLGAGRPRSPWPRPVPLRSALIPASA